MSLCPHLTTGEVCDLLGLTYRQVDHICTFDRPGTGNHRRWDDTTINRLLVAKALLAAVAFTTSPRGSSWPVIVDAVMAAPDPVPGWVTVTPEGDVAYHGPAAPYGFQGVCARWRPINRWAS